MKKDKNQKFEQIKKDRKSKIRGDLSNFFKAYTSSYDFFSDIN